MKYLKKFLSTHRYFLWLGLGGLAASYLIFSYGIMILLRKENGTLHLAKDVMEADAMVFSLSCLVLVVSLLLYLRSKANLSFGIKVTSMLGGIATAIGAAFGNHFLAFYLLKTMSWSEPASQMFIMYGRPFRKRGKVNLADVRETDDWVTNKPYAVPQRDWLEAARGEHGSVAAFSNLSLQLSQLGSPPELLAGVHRAALDEIRHAQVAFSLDAARRGGFPQGPAPEKGVFGPAAHAFRLSKMALETFMDGCISEARSARALGSWAEAEKDETIREEILQIMKEEEEHVELSWRIFEWCLKELGQKGRTRLFRHLTVLLDREEVDTILVGARERLNMLCQAA